MTENILHETEKVIRLSSNTWKSCEDCSKMIGDADDIGVQINHYFDHGYKLLHIGTEAESNNGSLLSITVAIMGK